jgi:hypothetical protein
VWFSLEHPNIHSLALHFVHFVWMVLSLFWLTLAVCPLFCFSRQMLVIALFQMTAAMLLLEWLVANLSLQWSRLCPRPACVGFVVDKWRWDRFFLAYFSFPLSVSFHSYSILINWSLLMLYIILPVYSIINNIHTPDEQLSLPKLAVYSGHCCRLKLHHFVCKFKL